jgi:hypothetical protein
MSNKSLIQMIGNHDSALAIMRSAIREEIELHRIEGRPVSFLRDGKVVTGLVEDLEREEAELAAAKTA